MAKKAKKITVRVKPSKARARAQSKQSEVTAIGKALRALGGIGGSVAGGLFGAPTMGGAVGTGLGAAISRWLGQGDYRVTQNSLVKSVANSSQIGSDTIPMMHNDGQSITVRHKEFICSIDGSIEFKVKRFFLLQPGDTNTFPWLSGVADRFQQYKVKGMVFHYVPTSGYAVSGTNPAIGAVMIQTSYRANDTQPQSKIEMLNEYWASESAPCTAFCHPIECSPKENPFQVHYTRTKPVPTNDSPLLYDMGVTYIATQGMPDDGKIVGDLWVTYEIELIKPQISSSVLGDVFSGQAITFTSVAPSTPFGTTAITGIGSVPFSAVNRTITFPIGLLGTYIVNLRFASTSLTVCSLNTAPTYANCVGAAIEVNGNTFSGSVITGAPATVNSLFYSFGVRLNNPSTTASVELPVLSWTGVALGMTVSVASLE